MKKSIILSAAFAVLAICSCGQKALDVPITSEKVTFNLGVVSPAPTRASGSVNTGDGTRQTNKESQVNTIQVFVFNGGLRDGYQSADITDQSKLTVSDVACTAGSRKVYAIVNAPSLSSVQSEEALLSAVSVLAEDDDNFEMIGHDTKTIANGSNVAIQISRIASKIVLKKITNNLSSGVALKLKRVYITNVAANINYGLSAFAGTSDTWYNKGGYQASNNLGTFTNDVSLDVSIAHNASYDTQSFYYYAYPNNKTQSGYASSWTPKRTMLVVQIEANDTLYDYPIDLGISLEANKMYVINELVLQKIGNKDDGAEGGIDEENPITGVTANFTITVKDWDVQLLGSSGVVTI